MHSNNDGMPSDWKPSPGSPFLQYMNAKKSEYLATNPKFYNTVHVTNWAEDYVRNLERELAAEKSRAQKLVEALRKLSDDKNYNLGAMFGDYESGTDEFRIKMFAEDALKEYEETK